MTFLLTCFHNGAYTRNMNITTITAREILRNYKQIFAKVKQTRQPAVVMSQKEPQVAIVSLEDLKVLESYKNKNSAKALIEEKDNQLIITPLEDIFSLAGSIKPKQVPEDFKKMRAEFTRYLSTRSIKK